ncbi:hypothetical protein Pmar_PMAR017210 [Perkinsus marinus ATCC 50983]|uniref:Uncharacterized protein n=1 Tax=Perkinsus marinus (strain ATCC 50983 / TXsc) TaxID=423536 RepID=C5KM24_PERM5|nr:hypothetical protein Pmar_PMAR017210 [Perkinsus marinus ATCC 50983]EER14469.1 hypothetical protein Pmar_PMAR017210 [Perkinsus marinus ATCC 50983]|eukprot:XP_002782674.1 hypothetical protein Pmar_PMAR017210 [Perkinsus marinus ATCC 50983]
MQSGTKLSESAKALAAAIRDVEGEHEGEWTAVTISRGTANRINKQHIGAIPGNPVTFNAGISDHRPPAEDEDIGVIGIPLVVKLKLGCRIVFTKNCRGAYCNGDLGLVTEMLNVEGVKQVDYGAFDEACELSSVPVIRVKLDRTGQEITVEPVTQTVTNY